MAREFSKGEPWGGARAVEATQARQSFREMVDEAYAGGRRVVIMRHGRAVAALVAIKDFLRLRDHDRAADLRMLERRRGEGPLEAVPIENLIGVFEAAEAGSARNEDGEIRFGEIPAEQVASDVVAQYIESPEFLYRAQSFVIDLISGIAKGRTEFTAAEASALKMALLANLVDHGLMTHERV